MEAIKKLAEREFQLKELLENGAAYDDEGDCRICFNSKFEDHAVDCWIETVEKELGVHVH